MKKQFVLILLCLISVLAVKTQVRKTEDSSFSANLPEIQVSPWNLDYQIKLQNIQNPQFADVIRKRFLKNKLSNKQELEEDKLKRIIFIGAARIKDGKASTTFKYNPHITLKDYLILKTDSYELRKIIEQNAEICLKLFRQALREEKLAQNDIVDAGALAFYISYQIFFGETPSKAHMKWMREKGREILLNLPSFQGVGDAERQRTFEIFGVLTMYAKTLQKRGLAGDKEAAVEAKETAEEVLKEVWGNSTDSIEMLPVGFIHKGQKRILDGKATQIFKFNPDLPTPRKLSPENPQIENQYRNLLQQIYERMTEKQVRKDDLAACGTFSFSEIYPFISELGELNSEQFQGVYKVFQKAVLSSADIQAASDENKQIACEVFAIRANLLKKQLSENPSNKIIAEQFIQDLFRAYNEEFRNYKMTSSNFLKIGSSTAFNK